MWWPGQTQQLKENHICTTYDEQVCICGQGEGLRGLTNSPLECEMQVSPLQRLRKEEFCLSFGQANISVKNL